MHDRFQEWRKADVFHRVWKTGLLEYDELKGREVETRHDVSVNNYLAVVYFACAYITFRAAGRLLYPFELEMALTVGAGFIPARVHYIGHTQKRDEINSFRCMEFGRG